jgi:hypothetical protein
VLLELDLGHERAQHRLRGTDDFGPDAVTGRAD